MTNYYNPQRSLAAHVAYTQKYVRQRYTYTLGMSRQCYYCASSDVDLGTVDYEGSSTTACARCYVFALEYFLSRGRFPTASDVSHIRWAQ